MRQPATATTKGEKKMDDDMNHSLERFRCFGILPGKCS
jgi:hypothetical protein